MREKTLQPIATLTLRELNRATLARQMLLEREAIGPVEAVERLAGLQAQYSPSPYISLWSRLEGFQREYLTTALTERTIIKASLMRWTLHLLSAQDYPFFNKMITDSRIAGWRNIAAKAGLDVPALHTKLLDFASQPRTQSEMIEYLQGQVVNGDDLHPRMIWHAAGSLGWLVHTPPSGTWRYFGKSPYIAAQQWLGDLQAPSLETSVAHVVRRYLAAFGPSTRADVVQWAGLRKVSLVDSAIKELGDEVIAFKDQNGSIYYDMVNAPRPDADTASPPRFLPKWDNLLLAYQNRERVLPDRYRKTVIKVNGDVMPTFLVNGVVAGEWSAKLERDTAYLNLEPFEPIDNATKSLLEEEGSRLVRFIEPDAYTYEVRIKG